MTPANPTPRARWKLLLAVGLALAMAGLLAAMLLLRALDKDALVGAAAEALQAKTQRSLTVAGPVEFTIFPTLGARLNEVSVSEPGGTGEFARVQSLRVGLAVLPLLTGRAEVEAFRAAGVKVAVVKDARGQFNFDDLLRLMADPAASEGGASSEPRSSKDPSGSGLPMALAVESILLEDLSLSYRDLGSGLRAELSEVSLRTSAIVPGRPSAVDLQGLLRLNQPSLALRFGIAGDLLLRLGEAGRVDITALRIDLESRLAQAAAQRTRLEGRMGMDLNTQRISGDLRADALDLDALLAQPTQAAAYAALGAGLAPVSANSEDASIDLSGLKALNLDLTLAVGQMKASNLRLSEVSARLDAQGGSVRVAPLKAKAYGGTVAGNLSAQAVGQRLAAQATFDGIEINPLLIDLANRDVLEGRGKLVLQLQTSGRSIRGLKSALAGSAAIDLRDGAVKGINLAERVRTVQGYLGGAPASAAASAAEPHDTQKKTDFTAMTMSWQIAQGIARSNDLNLMSPLFRIGGAGEANLIASTLDYLVSAKVVNTITGQDGKPIEKTRGITVPVRVKGPFSAVGWEIDTEALLKANLQSQIDKQKERLGGKANEAVDKALRNLLNR